MTEATWVSEADVLARSLWTASKVVAPTEVCSGSSTAGKLSWKAPSHELTLANDDDWPTSTSGEVAIDGTTTVGTDWPSSARATQAEESGTHRSGRLGLPLATLPATVSDGAELMVNCAHGEPLSFLPASDFAADSSCGSSSGVVLSET